MDKNNTTIPIICIISTTSFIFGFEKNNDQGTIPNNIPKGIKASILFVYLPTDPMFQAEWRIILDKFDNESGSEQEADEDENTNRYPTSL